MKALDYRDIRAIQAKIRRQGGLWIEGVSQHEVELLQAHTECLYGYWKEAKSYILHKRGVPIYWCVTKKVYDRDNLFR